MPALILFDLDGTLTDPVEGIINSVAYAGAQMGLRPLTVAEQRRFLGPPLQDSFAELGLDPAGVAEAVRHYRDYFAAEGIYENRIYDGIPAALDDLAASGMPLAVATSKPAQFAERILSHFALADYFSCVSGATIDGSRRHKTDVIDFALAKLGVAPAAAVMVGDRAQDVLGAAASGVRCVGVRWGYAEPGELEAAGASQILEAPSDLRSAVVTAG